MRLRERRGEWRLPGSCGHLLSSSVHAYVHSERLSLLENAFQRLWSTDQQLQVPANFGRAVGPWRRPGSDSEVLWGSVVLLSWFCCDLATCLLALREGRCRHARQSSWIPWDSGHPKRSRCPWGVELPRWMWLNPTGDAGSDVT